jgi:hypothetical protein
MGLYFKRLWAIATEISNLIQISENLLLLVSRSDSKIFVVIIS